MKQRIMTIVYDGAAYIIQYKNSRRDDSHENDSCTITIKVIPQIKWSRSICTNFDKTRFRHKKPLPLKTMPAESEWDTKTNELNPGRNQATLIRRLFCCKDVCLSVPSLEGWITSHYNYTIWCLTMVHEFEL